MAIDRTPNESVSPTPKQTKRVRMMLSTRCSSPELDVIYRAARLRGRRLATWIREGALERSRQVLAYALIENPMDPKNLKPCGANVVIRRKKTEAQTASGIVLPGKERETTIYCEVLAIGPECSRAKPGETVIVVPLAGLDLDVDDMAVIAEKDVLAVVTDAA